MTAAKAVAGCPTTTERLVGRIDETRSAARAGPVGGQVRASSAAIDTRGRTQWRRCREAIVWLLSREHGPRRGDGTGSSREPWPTPTYRWITGGRDAVRPDSSPEDPTAASGGDSHDAQSVIRVAEAWGQGGAVRHRAPGILVTPGAPARDAARSG